jgi:glycogen phosphorylase
MNREDLEKRKIAYFAIEAIGYKNIEKYHMNEGYASLLALELLERTKKDVEWDIYRKYDLESARNKCIFTTHTPVAAGHDRFPLDLVKKARLCGLLSKS